MLKGIVLGKYIRGDSLIHNLDPRTKILVLIPILSAITASDNITFLTGYFVLFIAGFFLSRISFKYLLNNIRPFILILLITFCIHLFFSSGRIIVNLSFIKITEEGMIRGGLNTFKIFLLLIKHFL